MQNSGLILETPWDSKVFGINTYELGIVSEDIISEIKNVKGHFTVKVSPLSNTKLLHEAGFYYCDTLLEPFVSRNNFIKFSDDRVSLKKEFNIEDIVSLSKSSFNFGRFHRDFLIHNNLADLRYGNWIRQLYSSNDVTALFFEDKLAGFFANSNHRILLHALTHPFKGKGLAKFFWSEVIGEMFKSGHEEITSSVSAANLAVVNLYISLGFKFRNAVDVYHKTNF